MSKASSKQLERQEGGRTPQVTQHLWFLSSEGEAPSLCERQALRPKQLHSQELPHLTCFPKTQEN